MWRCLCKLSVLADWVSFWFCRLFPWPVFNLFLLYSKWDSGDCCAADSLLMLNNAVASVDLISQTLLHAGTQRQIRQRTQHNHRCIFSFIAFVLSIWGRHLCLACRGKSCKDNDCINVWGYYVPFQQYISPNPHVIYPCWIQAPDYIYSQSLFGFTLCFGFKTKWYILFLPQ